MRKILAIAAAIVVTLAGHYLFGLHVVGSDASNHPKTFRRIEPYPDAIDLNSATRQDLTRLPGVGPVTAERIMVLRSALGRFERTEQLILVAGISEKKFRKIQEYIRVDD